MPTCLKQDLYPHSSVPLEPPRWLLSSLEPTGESEEDRTLWEDTWGQLRPTLLENLQPEVLTLQPPVSQCSPRQQPLLIGITQHKRPSSLSARQFLGKIKTGRPWRAVNPHHPCSSSCMSSLHSQVCQRETRGHHPISPSHWHFKPVQSGLEYSSGL